jgi:hypothetical protein
MWEPLSQADTERMTFMPCECEPGDVVFFDSFTPYHSSPNVSSEPRRLLYITYNRLAEGDHRLQYHADKCKSYPPYCERKLDEQYRFKV